MKVTVNVPDHVANEARKRGVSVEVYVEEMLRDASPAYKRESVSEAIDRIFELRKGNNLAGLKIKDLIDEGRKY